MASTAVQHGLAPNVALHSSQNTAPVLEFRCLFTHDILKKQKKWHDGSLRFHTFNRRVMVYDDSKNFIGDLHYRQADEFCEGLEFQLDKPVKVVVEEQLGVTKTDLVPLLGRSRQDDYTQAEVVPLVRSIDGRFNSTNTQGRPKSIKELLGASQGRFGRAMLPPRSPFEQRQALSENYQPEPSSKRRKLASGKENSTVTVLPKSILSQEQRHVTGNLPFVLTSGPISDPNQLPIQNEVTDLLSSNGPQASRLKSNDLAPTHQKAKKKQTAAKKALTTQNAIEAILGVSAEARKSKVSKRKIVRPESRPVQEQQSRLERDPKPPAPTNARKTSRTDFSSTSVGPRSCLSFAPLNPRRKLLYRALLPEIDGNIQENGSMASGLVNSPPTGVYQSRYKSAQTRMDRRNGTTTTDLDEFFDDLADEQPLAVPDASLRHPSGFGDETVSDDPANRQRENITQETSDTNVLNIGSSPLFLTQNASQISELAPQIVKEDDLLLSSPSDYAPANIEESNAVPTEHVDSDEEDSFTRPGPSVQDQGGEQSNTVQVPAATALQPIDGADLTLTIEHNQPIGSQPRPDRSSQNLSHPASPAQRTSPVRSDSLWEGNANSRSVFRRVRSENDADAASDPVDPSEIGSVTVATDRRSRLLQQPLLPPTKILQRTTSDSTVIMHQQTSSTSKPVEKMANRKLDTEHVAPAESSPVYETGPWTAIEAFLLFDWWPEGKRKKKPNYGQIEAEASNDGGLLSRNNQSTVLPGVESRKYGMFGSARFVSQR